jgi:hypothetical protein
VPESPETPTARPRGRRQRLGLTAMLAPSLDTAQIRIVLISDDKAHIDSILSDINKSKLHYIFMILSNRGELFFNIYSEFKNIRNKIPTVFIFDYSFSSYFIKSMIESLNGLEDAAPVDFVVLDAPANASTRFRLKQLGATLYDTAPAPARAESELTLH